MSFDKSQVYQYLGYRGNVPQQAILALIDSCLGELQTLKTIKYVYQIFDIAVAGDVELLGIGKIQSQSLASHLQGCDKLAIMAVTLGVDADMQILKYNKLDMTKAVVYDACCSAYVEYVCDNVEDEIKQNEKLLGLCPVSRFSPGYGDFSLEYQKTITQLLQCQKNIGLTLSESLLLVPTKSVTALIGFSQDNCLSDNRDKCASCNMREHCSFTNWGKENEFKE